MRHYHEFRSADTFNQPLNEWNVSNVRYMDAMFYEASSFNQSLLKWNTQNVISAAGVFYGANKTLTYYPENVNHILKNIRK